MAAKVKEFEAAEAETHQHTSKLAGLCLEKSDCGTLIAECEAELAKVNTRKNRIETCDSGED